MTGLALLPAVAAAWVSCAETMGDVQARAAFERYILRTHARGSGAFAASAPPLEVQREIPGFRFASDLGCALPEDDAKFCELARPKPWTDAEMDAYSALLRGLQDGRLAGFFERVARNGFDTLVREEYATHLDAKRGLRRLFYPNSLHSNRLIVVTDMHFTLREYPAKPTLHLLAHAFDFAESAGGSFYPSLSVSPEFLRMTGFELAPQGQWTRRGMTPAQREEFWRLFEWKNDEALRARKLETRAQRAAVWDEIRRRTDAFAAPFGVVSFHSLLNPYEAFAEWAVLVHFDKEKALKLDPELTRWFAENVLR